MFSTLSVPSGIGDISWMYSKLKHVEPFRWLVADGWPARSVPYLKLLPQVLDADYGHFDYSDILRFEETLKIGATPTWKDLEKYSGGNLYLEANRHLEAGKPLRTWLPDLPTDYHYDIVIPETEAHRAAKLLVGLKRPIWGISAASYRGAEAWKTWGVEPWLRFLHGWLDFAGGTVLLMGANWDDLTFALSSEGGFTDLVGRTSVPMALWIAREIDGYIGFSSGLGIVRTVFNKPTMMMWPDHQAELSRSWVDPEMLENGTYAACHWLEPEKVLPVAKAWHRRSYS